MARPLVYAAVLLVALLHSLPSGSRAAGDAAALAQAQRDLRLAAGMGDVAKLKSAIEAGASVDHKKGDGTTPLGAAARKGQAACVVELLRAGASVDLPGAGDLTALMNAARLVDTETLSVLLAGGASPNVQMANGWTALMYAAKDGNRGTVAMLLAAGADKTLTSGAGKTALQWAQESSAAGKAEVVALLEATSDGAAAATAAAGTENKYVRCETEAWSPDKGAFVSDAFTLELHRDWAPLGFDRFMELVRSGFFTDNLIYRTIPGAIFKFNDDRTPFFTR